MQKHACLIVGMEGGPPWPPREDMESLMEVGTGVTEIGPGETGCCKIKIYYLLYRDGTFHNIPCCTNNHYSKNLDLSGIDYRAVSFQNST